MAQDFAERVTMLKAVASATEQRFGPQLLHLAVAMIRNGLVGEAMGVLSRGLLPRSALVRVLTERIPEFSACLFQACLKEVAATLIPESVSRNSLHSVRCGKFDCMLYPPVP